MINYSEECKKTNKDYAQYLYSVHFLQEYYYKYVLEDLSQSCHIFYYHDIYDFIYTNNLVGKEVEEIILLWKLQDDR